MLLYIFLCPEVLGVYGTAHDSTFLDIFSWISQKILGLFRPQDSVRKKPSQSAAQDPRPAKRAKHMLGFNDRPNVEVGRTHKVVLPLKEIPWDFRGFVNDCKCHPDIIDDHWWYWRLMFVEYILYRHNHCDSKKTHKPVPPCQVDGQAVPQMTKEQAPGSLSAQSSIPAKHMLCSVSFGKHTKQHETTYVFFENQLNKGCWHGEFARNYIVHPIWIIWEG